MLKIEKISKITGVASYANFTGQKDTIKGKNDTVFPDLKFSQKNLIFGFNFSGKTTLSKIIALIGGGVPATQIWPGCKISITLSDNSIIDETNLHSSPLKVRVFNNDYILEKSQWYQKGKKNKGILFDIGEHKELKNEKTRLEKENKEIESKISLLEKDIDYVKFTEFDRELFTKVGKAVLLELKSLINFNKRDVTKWVDEFDNKKIEKISDMKLELQSKLLVDKEYQDLLATSVLTQNYLSIVPLQLINTKYNYEFFERVNDLLKKFPGSVSVKIEELDKHNEAREWVLYGLHLHNDKERCYYCDSVVSADRTELLRAFFSKEELTLRDNIKSIEFELNNLSFEEYSLDLSTLGGRMYPECKSELEPLIEPYIKISKQISEFLSSVRELLHQKQSNLFEIFEFDNIFDELQKDLTSIITDISKLIDKHNHKCLNFNDSQNMARKAIIDHQIAKFLIDNNYFQIRKNRKKIENEIEKNQSIIEINNERIRQIEKLTVGIAKGAEKLNDMIERLFGKPDFKVEVEQDSYKIVRGTQHAEHLSEGEKTGILFSFFLTELEGLESQGQLSDCLICIDDPVTSLDGSNLAKISTFIHSFFWKKDATNGEMKMIVNQLFVSTHHFQFFKILQDGKFRDPKCQYLVKRSVPGGSSEIVRLPKFYSKNSSEYNMLWSNFLEIIAVPNYEHDKICYVLPNIMRRILEAYTISRLPGSALEELDTRLELLSEKFDNIKSLHYFSHLSSINRIEDHDQLIGNIPNVVKEFIDFFQTVDKQHYDSIENAIKVSP